MKRKLTGKIVSDKMQSTAVVAVSRLKKHPKYLKYYKVTKRYKAHNPENKFKTGDEVVIEESRPLSKDKRFAIIALINGKKGNPAEPPLSGAGRDSLKPEASKEEVKEEK